jgi:uncharacterized protein (DUF1330 family)
VTAYAIAALKFTDRDAYSRYPAAFMDAFQRYSGTLLAADQAPLVSAVPDEPAFREWAESPDYQWISGDRHTGVNTVVLLAQALPRTG